MNLYETTFITSSQLDEAATEQEIKKVEDLIRNAGGELVTTERWGVRRLAYEIKKQRQGYYAHFLYKAPPEVPAAIESSFRLNEQIMRFLTVLSSVDLAARARAEAETEAEAATTAAPVSDSGNEHKSAENTKGEDKDVQL